MSDLTIPADHASRTDRAHTSLEGLSVGDAFGEQFFRHTDVLTRMLSEQTLPEAPWYTTDDTEMAIALYDVLSARGEVDQDAYAAVLTHRFRRDPNRGYGAGARSLLTALLRGMHWSRAASRLFEGQGSHGNGAAMRVAPLGAFFADDLEMLVLQAKRSARVTHQNDEGVAGAVAVALGAAYAVRHKLDAEKYPSSGMLAWVAEQTPTSLTATGIHKARGVSFGSSAVHAGAMLGNGTEVTAMDTVPFVLWSAARALDDFTWAQWQTVSALGDRDTTCAMVGGIVACSVGIEGIPAAWRTAREVLLHDRIKPVDLTPAAAGKRQRLEGQVDLLDGRSAPLRGAVRTDHDNDDLEIACDWRIAGEVWSLRVRGARGSLLGSLESNRGERITEVRCNVWSAWHREENLLLTATWTDTQGAKHQGQIELWVDEGV